MGNNWYHLSKLLLFVGSTFPSAKGNLHLTNGSLIGSCHTVTWCLIHIHVCFPHNWMPMQKLSHTYWHVISEIFLSMHRCNGAAYPVRSKDIFKQNICIFNFYQFYFASSFLSPQFFSSSCALQKTSLHNNLHWYSVQFLSLADLQTKFSLSHFSFMDMLTFCFLFTSLDWS